MRIRSILSLFFVAAALTGCVDDNPAFFIRANVAPDSQCTWSPASPLTGHGVLDLTVPNQSYSLYPVFQSQLKSRVSQNPPRVDTNGIQVMSANITLTDSTGAALPIPQSSYSVTVAGFVPTSLDNSPGEAAGYISAIPALAVDAIRDLGLVSPGNTFDIVVHLTVAGRTVGGSDVQTDEWSWPITLCADCLHCAGEPPEMLCHPGQDGEGWFDASCDVD